MDIFRERELLERQEEDFQVNNQFESLPIPKQKVIKTYFNFFVGDLVWLNNVGPRYITSYRQGGYGGNPFVTLAEEYGRFSVDKISKYRILEHLEIIDSIKRLDWNFIYKYGLPLCLIPMELTVSAMGLIVFTDIVFTKEFSIVSGLISFVGLVGSGWFLYLTYEHIKKFIQKIKDTTWERNQKKIMEELRGDNIPPQHRHRFVIRNNAEEEPVWNLENDFVELVGDEDEDEEFDEEDVEEAD